MSPRPIVVENVSKKYCKSIKRSMAYGIGDIAKNLIGLGTHPDRLRPEEFWAVRGVSFELERGQTLGLIGANGSGKTTLLKMLNGIFWPDTGRITMRGRVGALIAVGSGFHPMLTGAENIFLNGAILGMGRREMRKKFDSIVDFSGVEKFLNTPVKYYSSGMYVRLGFAVAIHCEPDILLVDEVLAVGDIEFQARCIQKMEELKVRGVTKIFVSHDLNAVQRLCDRTLYLHEGNMRHYGDTLDVLAAYKRDALLNTRAGMNDGVRFGTKEITLNAIEFLDSGGRPKNLFKRGEPFRLRVNYHAKTKISDPEFSIAFNTERGVEVTKATTRDHAVTVGDIEGDGEFSYSIESLPFNVGRYYVSVGCWNPMGRVAFDHHEKLYELLVEDGTIGGKIRERFGLVHVPARWTISRTP